MCSEYNVEVGVIGGSGLYDLKNLNIIDKLSIKTPFGDPSDVLSIGKFNNSEKKVVFLPRHGELHNISPHMLNHRANIYALKSLGVKYLLSVCAVGSLRENVQPQEILFPDQIIDFSSRKSEFTFFDKNIIAHSSFAEPFSKKFRNICLDVAKEKSFSYHERGTYINIDGPSFSSKAESDFYRQIGADIIGMTISGEIKLAREADIATAGISIITDYDCWHESKEAVTVEMAIENLRVGVGSVKKIIKDIIINIPENQVWDEHKSLKGSIITPNEAWSDEDKSRLKAILPKY